MKPMTSQFLPVLATLTLGTAAGAASPPFVEHQTQQFLNVLAAGKGMPLERMPVADARAVPASAQAGVKLDLPETDVAHKTITVNDKTIALTIVRPAGVTTRLPVFMFFHGGGWILGDFPTHERFVRDLVVGSEAAAVFVNYSRSPEARYPVAIEEAYAATRWVAAHGNEIDVDGSPVSPSRATAWEAIWPRWSA